MPIQQLVFYILGFIGMWIGAGLAISPITKLAKSLHLSAFNLSFIILGIATSVSELSVGLNAVTSKDPEIFVGNLLGASLILFLFVIPFLAVFGNRLHINKELRGEKLPLVLGVVGLPALLSFDGMITHTDAGISLCAYIFMVLFVQTRSSVLERIKDIKSKKLDIFSELVKIILGVIIIFFASRLVVEETMYFANMYNVSPFLVSLLVISLGTNLPEIALGVRSIFLSKNDLAFADYVGSAAFNTFIFGFLTFLVGSPIKLTNSYWLPLLTTLLGLTLFYIFARSKYTLSRRESMVLLLVYIGFLTAEVLK